MEYKELIQEYIDVSKKADPDNWRYKQTAKEGQWVVFPDTTVFNNDITGAAEQNARIYAKQTAPSKYQREKLGIENDLYAYYKRTDSYLNWRSNQIDQGLSLDYVTESTPMMFRRWLNEQTKNLEE